MSTFATFTGTCIALINTLNEWIGRIVSWLTLLMVLVTVAVVMLRYVFDIGWIAMQESVTYMHATLFMLGAAYTLSHDGHVRVDIFYQHCSTKIKAWIDLLGSLLLLLPLTGLISWTGWEYVIDSWEIRESSRNSGGLPGIYLLKSNILLMAALLALQGMAIILSSLLTIVNAGSPREAEHG